MNRTFSIKPNHGSEIPSSLVFVDTETELVDPLATNGSYSQQFRLGCACHVRLRTDEPDLEDWFPFATTEQFWTWLETKQSPHRPLWVFAHNWSFDFTILDGWKKLEDKEYEWGEVEATPADPRFQGQRPFQGMMIIAGRPFLIEALGRRGRVLFCDSGNYFPVKLAELAKPHEAEKTAWPGWNTSDEDLSTYCKNDVVVLKTAMIDLLRRWQAEHCGTWQWTSAKLAFTSWRHLAKRDKAGRHFFEVIPQRDETPDLLEREGYCGGWVECFFHGRAEETLYELDRRQAYPAEMLNLFVPTVRTHHWPLMPLDEFGRRCSSSNAIARVYLNADTRAYPVRTTNGLVQAMGRFWTTLGGVELQDAFNRGDIIEVREVSRYETAPIMREFVLYWWERCQRDEDKGDHADLAFCKMILKSLSGKWGQISKHWESVPWLPCPSEWGEFESIDHQTGEITKCRAIAGSGQMLVDKGIPPWGMPCISAWITAANREWMRKAIAACPPKSVYHIATDSLIVNAAGKHALGGAGLVHPKELGYLRQKREHFGGYFRGQNNYRIGDRVVQAGAWGHVREKDEHGGVYDRWQSVKETVSKRPDGVIRVHRERWVDESPTNKGLFGSDGWSSPIWILQPQTDYRALRSTDRRIQLDLFGEPVPEE